MQPGARTTSLRGEASWRGMGSSSRQDLGDHRWSLLQNCYVSPDGVEIRKLPGWKCVYDFSGTRTWASTSLANGAQPGFLRTIIDGWGPAVEAQDDYWLSVADPTYRQLVYAPQEFLHGFKRIKGRLVAWGETGFRREPIYNSAQNAFVTVLSWETGTNKVTLSAAPSNNGTTRTITSIAGGPTIFILTSTGAGWTVNQWVGFGLIVADPTSSTKKGVVTANTADTVTFTTFGFTALDGSETGLYFSIFSGDPDTGSDRPFNSVRGGSLVWIGDIPTGDTGSASLRNQLHTVLHVEGSTLTLETAISANGSATADVEIARVMPAHDFPSNYPRTRYATRASWDKISLGAWVSVDKPDVDDVHTDCFPLHVFNRQRDYGDMPHVGREHIEGGSRAFEIAVNGLYQVSRRHQKELPFRTNPDVAADKILLGAPGYGCVFQIPMSGTVDPLPGNDDVARGIIGLWANTMFDKPRALGVPKGVMWADSFRRSDETSAHFYETSDATYAWGGYRSIVINRLVTGTATYAAAVFHGNGHVQQFDISGAYAAGYFSPVGNGGFNTAGVATLTAVVFRIQVPSGDGTIDDFINTRGDDYWSGQAYAGSGTAAGLITINPTSAMDPYRDAGSFSLEMSENATGNVDYQKFTASFNRTTGVVRYTIEGVTLDPDAHVGGVVRIVVPENPDGTPTTPFGYHPASFAYHRITANGADWVETEYFDPDSYAGFYHPALTGDVRWMPRISLAADDDRYGTYKFRVAYRDTATGEVGLLSEELELGVEANGNRHNVGTGIRLFIKHPGYLLAESGALQVELYRTGRNGNTYFFDSIVPMHPVGSAITSTPDTARVSSTFGVVSSVAPITAMHFVAYDVPYKSDEELVRLGSRYIPTIEQMPVGCTAVRTIKGITLFGGHIGNAGDALDLIHGTTSFGLTDGPNTLYSEPDQLTIRGGGSASNNPDGYGNTAWLAAQDCLPTAYAGVGAEFYIPTGLPGQCRGFEVTSVTHAAGPADAELMSNQKLTLARSPLLPETELTAEEDLQSFLKLKTGFYNYSILGQPGVVPATNIGFIDADNDEDIQAIGAFNGGSVICTRSNTYYMSWVEDGPRSTPDFVTNEHGCIATNTMVEYDGGTAWIGDRGPVALTGEGTRWIGRDLEREFFGPTARYLRDSRGLMRHAWGCHDPERGLIYWGLYTEKDSSLTISYAGTTYTWGSANDEKKSRFPCNEILVWSYRTDTFSRWVMPSGFGIKWMERDTDIAGSKCTLFLGSDDRIYQLDDLYQTFNKDVVSVTVPSAGTGATLTITPSIVSWGITTAAMLAGNYAAVGMEVLLGRGTTTVVPLYRGTVTAVSATSITVTWDQIQKGSVFTNPSWKAGDTLQVGVRRMILESNWIAPSGTEKPRDSLSLHVRHTLESRFTRELAGDRGPEAVKLSVMTGKSPTGIDAQDFTSSVITTDNDELGNYRSLGLSTTEERTSQQIPKLPFRVGGANVKLKLELIGASQPRITDLLLEA